MTDISLNVKIINSPSRIQNRLKRSQSFKKTKTLPPIQPNQYIFNKQQSQPSPRILNLRKQPTQQNRLKNTDEDQSFQGDLLNLREYCQITQEMDFIDLKSISNLDQLFKQQFQIEFSDLNKGLYSKNINNNNDNQIRQVFHHINKICSYYQNKLSQQELDFQNFFSGEQLQSYLKKQLSIEGYRQQIQNYKLQNLQLISTMNIIQYEKKGILLQQNQQIQQLLEQINNILSENDYIESSMTKKYYSTIQQIYEKQKLESHKKINELEQKITDITFNIDNQIQENNKSFLLYSTALDIIWIPKQQLYQLFSIIDNVYQLYIDRNSKNLDIFLNSINKSIPEQEKLDQYIQLLQEKIQSLQNQKTPKVNQE